MSANNEKTMFYNGMSKFKRLRKTTVILCNNFIFYLLRYIFRSKITAIASGSLGKNQELSIDLLIKFLSKVSRNVALYNSYLSLVRNGKFSEMYDARCGFLARMKLPLNLNKYLGRERELFANEFLFRDKSLTDNIKVFGPLTTVDTENGIYINKIISKEPNVKLYLFFNNEFFRRNFDEICSLVPKSTQILVKSKKNFVLLSKMGFNRLFLLEDVNTLFYNPYGMNAMQSIVLFCIMKLNVKPTLVGFDFYSSLDYLDRYNKNISFAEICAGLRLHDVVVNFLFIRSLWLNDQVIVDNDLARILERGTTSYLAHLDDLFKDFL